ncbi:MAG TPA: 4-hydroxy-3-methylbut-2-enyl diphosphate reductase [Acidimicrobiia bacterium]
MKVYLGVPRGFCAGVVRAIDIVELALQRFGAPVYVKHEIVHNPHVVFSAHGSPPEDFTKATQRGLKVIDATCPLVTKVHNEARKYVREGRKIILVGHRGHQEVKGTMGQSSMHLVDDREVFRVPELPPDTPVTVLTQTTLSVDDTRRSIEQIRHNFSDVLVRNDLCYATTNRQAAVKELTKLVELILVIGAPNSSNCNRLREVAEANGVPAYLLNGPEEMNPSWFEGVERVGITSGASTPEELVKAVIDALNPQEVVRIEGADEDVNFVLPKELR